jgi:hypothetical protein
MQKPDLIDYCMDRIHKAKFCCDCRWLADVTECGGRIPSKFCVHGVRTTIDFVDGELTFIDYPKNPNVERHNPNLCGTAAKNYERKWWKFWRPK